MLDKYLEEQDIVTNLLIKSLNENKLVQAYLFSCDDINYIYNYAKDFTKEIVKASSLDDKQLEYLYKRIDDEEYTELKIVEPSGFYIKKEQLLELQSQTVNKPVEGKKIVYIIRNCEKLNAASANSILKFLEEPEEDIVAILLTDNINMVLPTIKSRCQILNFKNMKVQTTSENKLKKYLNLDESNIDDEQINRLIDSSIDVIETIEKKHKNTFIYIKDIFWDNFKTNDDILVLLNIFIYSYMDALYLKLDKKINYMLDYEGLIEFLSQRNSEEQITKKISIIESIKSDIRMNVNAKLLFDKLIIELSEV